MHFIPLLYGQMLGKNGSLYGMILYFSFLGVIRMASQMDRETKDQYLVIIQAKDMVGQTGAFSATATVTINLSDINDNPPKFQQREYSLLTVVEVLRKFRSTVALLSSLVGLFRTGLCFEFSIQI